jgi:hypothetical protein
MNQQSGMNPGITPFIANQMCYQQSNINNSHIPQRQCIPQDNTKNKGQLMHNNIGNDIKSQSIFTDHITISSNDRVTTISPSPFKFTVGFGNQDRDAVIQKNYKNVRELIFDSVILPRTIAIDVDNAASGSGYHLMPTASTAFPVSPGTGATISPANPLLNLHNYPYLIVRINDLNTPRLLGTSNNFDKNTFRIFPYQTAGIDAYLWKPEKSNNEIEYKISNLQNFDRLVLEILNPYGEPIYLVDKAGTKIIGTDIIGTPTGNDYNAHIALHKNTVASVKYTNMIMQVIYNFTIKVVEIEQTTRPTFLGN